MAARLPLLLAVLAAATCARAAAAPKPPPAPAVSVWNQAKGAYDPVKCKKYANMYNCYRLYVRVSGNATQYSPLNDTQLLTTIANAGTIVDIPTGQTVGAATGSVIVVAVDPLTGATDRLLTNVLAFGSGADAITVGGGAKQDAAGGRLALYRSVAGGVGMFSGALGDWNYTGKFPTAQGGLEGYVSVYVPKIPVF